MIGNILSFSDEELLQLQATKQLGVTVLSKLTAERDRDQSGKLTYWKTGRHFLDIAVPNDNLPKSASIGLFKGPV